MTQEEFNSLPAEAQATIRAGIMFRQLLGNKETADAAFALAEKAQKASNPSYRTAEEIAAPYVQKALADVDAKLKARDDESAKRDAESRLRSQIDAAKTEHGYTDEGIERILKNMTENGVGDFPTAMKADLHDHPVSAVPPGTADQMDWNFYPGLESGDNKGFFDGTQSGSPGITEDPSAWSRATALKYLNGDVKLPA